MDLSIVLVAAVLASLALGVLLAHGICVAMFQIFRIHSRQVAMTRSARTAMKPAVTGGVVEG
ncbi:hypothetical protein SAMN05421770_103204 [Granulicella rosea]|uniref:Uncharacterized protein n=1 Tax=Granulicella rosea TaxID=474952 RepID=A0A239INZ3_9BACT|nr:hypothetical protein [Granulicella rosea]SNS95267.1 hypothetical protein SAMN05421770_103204 [Granulicella rosea]